MSQVTHFQGDEADEGNSTSLAPSRAGGGDEGGEGRSLLPSLPSLSIFDKFRAFIHSVRLEMQKTTWPTRNQVWSTTVVVVIAVIFFGFYLWGCDRLFGLFFTYLEKSVR